MYINKLYLRAFGKFTYKRIYLGKKLNIIYGENETGKSTIHNFIESVLYGFDDNTKDVSLYKIYKPWDSNLYKGSITINEVDRKKYLITKDFLLGTTKVFNKELKNNENSSMEAENIDCPGNYFFNMNKNTYRNTISIKQLGNKTDKELSIEVKNKIINLSKSKDESISIDRILSTLNSVKNEAGSEDNPKTLLGQYALRLRELDDTKENILNINRQVMFLVMEKKKLNSKIQEIDMRVINLNKEILLYELFIEKDIYVKAMPIKIELDEITEKLSKYEEEDAVKKYSDKDYEEACKLSDALSIMRNERYNLINEKVEKQSDLMILEDDISNNIGDDFDIVKMNTDFSDYNINKIKINQMKSKIEIGEASLSEFNVDEINRFIDSYKSVEEYKNKVQIIKILLNDKNYDIMKDFIKSENLKGFMTSFSGTIFVLLAVLSGYVAYYYNAPKYYFGISISIVGIISYIISAKSRRRVLNARREIESIDCNNLDYNRDIMEINKQIEEILKHTECSNFYEFKRIYENKENQKNIIEEKSKLLKYDKGILIELEEISKGLEKRLKKDLNLFHLEEITDNNINKANDIYNKKDFIQEEIIKYGNIINEIDCSLSKIDKEIGFEEKRLNVILYSNKMSSMDEFNETIEHYQYLIDLKNKKEKCENDLSLILGKTNLDELRNKIENIITCEKKGIDKKELQITIYEFNEEKNKLQVNINNIDKEIEEIESNIRNLAEVEEEIEFYEDKKNIFNEKILVSEIAARKILEMSESIKGGFMPLFRKSISENFAYVTGGKYKEVLIDEDMNISVVRKDNKDRKIDIDSLSGGTLDQLYLSLRISISNILGGNQNIPIILDDSFVQYDSNRLKKSIEMLARESERRQVILFTCHEKEIEIAKNMKLEFDFIKL